MGKPLLQIHPRAPDQLPQAPAGLAVDLFKVQVEEVAVFHERAAGDQDVADGGAGGGEGDPVVGIGLGGGPGFGVLRREHEEVGDAGAELQVGAGAVNDARAMVPQPAEMPVGEPDAVSEAEVGCEQALVVEVVDFVPSSLESPDGGGLVLLLKGVSVDRCFAVAPLWPCLSCPGRGE